MQALTVEQSIFEGEMKVKEIFGFIMEQSEELNAYEIEKYIFSGVMRLGQIVMQCYFAQKGTGDVGNELTVNDVIFKKENLLRGRDYFSVFGKIKVPRTCFRKPGYEGVFPLDAQADLPNRCYSYLLQEWMNLLTIRDSYKESEITLAKMLGLEVSASRFEVINQESSGDYDEYYKRKELPKPEKEGEIQTTGFDGKGVPMIKRESAKLKGRQGKGEKRQKKKEAMVGVSYTVDRHKRAPEEVAENLIYPERAKAKREDRKNTSEPIRAKNIRRLASIEKSKEEVMEEIINDGKKRNKDNKRPWVVLMDGALGLWSLLLKMLSGMEYVGILDIIHVTEYLWKAGNSLHGENTIEGKQWVYEQLLSILRGGVDEVIGGLKQRISNGRLSKKKQRTLESVIRYFENHREWMRYDEYLRCGFPIGTGVVESTCSHTVKKRMEGSGRRWSIEGAESVLLLRSIYTSGDWDSYWQVHIRLERERIYGDMLETLCASDDYHFESQKIKKAA